MHIRFNIKGCLIYSFILIASVVFASFFGGLLPFVMLYGIILLIPSSVLCILLNYKFLSVYQELDSHRVVKGDRHDLMISFDNTGFLPVHGMELILHSDRCDFYGLNDRERVDVKARSGIKLMAKAVCIYGGAYDIGLKAIGLTDPFGIITAEINVSYNFRAIVSPKITDIANAYMDIENTANSFGSKSDVRTEEIPGNDMRDYSPGDPLRSINWKVSARLGRHMVRVPDKMDTRRITLILEASDMPLREQDTDFLKRRDSFLEFAVSAAWYFTGRGLPVNIIYPSGKITDKLVGSYESFQEFYSDVSGGMTYRSDDERDRMHKLVQERRTGLNGDGTSVIILEDRWNSEDYCIVIG
jgi:uncharacterized protein (DUF58 family)